MPHDPLQLQTPIALMIALCFVFFEKIHPIAVLNWKKEFKLDMMGLVAVTLSSAVAFYSLKMIFSSNFILGAFSFLVPLSHWPRAVRLVLAMVFVDFGLYWAHRLMHRSTFWPTHSWHHSSNEFYWLSGYRASFIHTFLYFLPPAIAYFTIFRVSNWDLLYLGSFGTLIQIFVHSNFKISFGPLDKLIVTPRFHRLHHDRDEIRDKNFGTILTIWDRMFGTYLDPARYPGARAVGLDEELSSPTRMMIGI